MSTIFAPRHGLFVAILAIVGCSNEPEGAPSIEPYNNILMRSALDFEFGNEIQMREILFAPGWKAPRHYHSSDLFIYVIAGEFEVDMEGSGPETYTDGQALRMKPNTPMDARNSSANKPLKLAVFQVGNPDSPFMVPVEELVEQTSCINNNDRLHLANGDPLES